MKANEITIAILKASKVVNLENGNVLEYLGASTWSESAYEKAKKEGENITLFKTSNKDTKARIWVAVNGQKSTYPYYIDELKKVAESGKLLTHKENFFDTGETTTNAPRQISESMAKKKNLCAVSYFETSANIVFLEAEAKHFEDALNLIADYKKRYGFSENRGATGNAFCALPTYKKYLTNKLHAAHRWEQYQKAHENRINTLRQNFESARTEAGEYTRVHASELAKREVLRKVQELSKSANEAEEKLEREQNRIFLTAEDVAKKYGL